MKKLNVVLFLLLPFYGSAQLLFYQNTYKGGISVDGRSYFGFNGFQADTINFQNIAPAGSTIKKAFLITQHERYPIYHDTKDNNLPIIFGCVTKCMMYLNFYGK